MKEYNCIDLNDTQKSVLLKIFDCHKLYQIISSNLINLKASWIAGLQDIICKVSLWKALNPLLQQASKLTLSPPTIGDEGTQPSSNTAGVFQAQKKEYIFNLFNSHFPKILNNTPTYLIQPFALIKTMTVDSELFKDFTH